jgi:hypothetical protein
MNSCRSGSSESNTGIQSRFEPNSSANRSRSPRSLGAKLAVHIDSECISRWMPWGRCFIASSVMPCDRASRQYIWMIFFRSSERPSA